MISRNILTILTLAFVLTALSIFALSCGGSNAQSNTKQANVAATPQAVEVTTAKAITRDLPRFLEATGSLAAEEQTDVAPAVGGKVVSGVYFPSSIPDECVTRIRNIVSLPASPAAS